jgi:hypothetical protein
VRARREVRLEAAERHVDGERVVVVQLRLQLGQRLARRQVERSGRRVQLELQEVRVSVRPQRDGLLPRDVTRGTHGEQRPRLRHGQPLSVPEQLVAEVAADVLS